MSGQVDDNRLTAEGNDWRYHDGRVSAVLSIYGEHCAIMEFSSLSPGSGHARMALKWIRQNFETVAVIDPGSETESPNSFGFWSKMAADGMVDSLVDADGYKIFESGCWVRATLDSEAYPETYQDLFNSQELDKDQPKRSHP